MSHSMTKNVNQNKLSHIFQFTNYTMYNLWTDGSRISIFKNKDRVIVKIQFHVEVSRKKINMKIHKLKQ
jgi:GMP synthase-like glutamine amidotransferase